MKRNVIVAILGSLLILSLYGCDKKKPGPEESPSIAGVADLDRMADEIGVNAKYKEYVIGYRDRLKKKLSEDLLPMQQELEKTQRELRAELDGIPEAERKKPDWKPPAAAERLYRKVIDTQQEMQAAGQASDAKLQEYDRKVKQDFQQAIQPALSAICQSKGVRVLMPRGANLYCHPDADLTNALIAYLK